jgi:trans-AT polyketide synthase, acyltransferase and oxidoreductase domains
MSQPVKSSETQTAEAIQTWLITQIAKRSNIDPDQVDIQASFESFALESAAALVLLTQLEQWLGRSVPPMLIWNYPTIELLSERLAAGDEDEGEDEH